MFKQSLSKQLKAVIIGMAVCGALIYFWAFPTIGHMLVQSYPETQSYYLPWLIFLWISGIPCYLVLCFMWQIAKSIAENKAFSFENSKRFRKISVLAISDTTFFFVGNIILLLMNMNHPSIVLCSMGVVFAGITIAVISKAFAHLANQAAQLQEQSDLTI